VNKNKIRYVKQVLGVAVLAAMAGQAMAEVSFDANIELNTDAVDAENADTTYDQNGRVEVNAFGRHEKDGYFVQGRGTALLNTDGEADVDDAWIQFGNSTWDLQGGRFEAANLFPLGKDTLVVHAGGDDVSVYAANKARGRVGDGGGQLALHLNASESLKFELGTVFGDPEVDGDNTTAFSGVRPVVTFMGEGFSLSAGYERISYDLDAGGDVDQDGFAITTSFNVGAAAINLSASHGEDDNTDEEVDSYAANMVYGNFGAGLIYSQLDQADTDVTTAYVAYTVPLFDIDNASVTFAGSTSSADGVSDAVSDQTNALRVRFNYTF